MSRKKSMIIVIILVVVVIGLMSLPFILAPKISKREREEIIDTFNGFDNNDRIILTYSDRIFLQDKIIDISSINYNDQRCYLIDCSENSFYAYTFEKIDNSNCLNLLEIDYDTMEVKYIDTINNIPRSGTSSSFYWQNKLYKGIYNDNYYVYDLDKKTYTLMSEADANAMRNESTEYSFNVVTDKKLLGNKHSIEITDKATQETKTVTMDDLNGFVEGKYILSLNSYLTRSFFSKAIEKNGEIYILGMIRLNTLSLMSECVILKYDFENDELSYYSAMYYDYGEVPNDMYIF